MKKFDVRKVVILSAMSAITIVLYCFLKFPLPIFPKFLEFNFSMLPVLITVFMFGMVEGLMLVLMRFLGKIIISGTSTMYVGELADIILAVIVVLAVSLVYKSLKKKKSPVSASLFALGAGIIGWSIGAMIANWLVIIPAYVHIAKYPMAAIIGMSSMIPGINESNFMMLYLFVGVLPFNICLSTVVSIVTFIVHNRTRHIFEKE